jgi:hypothetical protein
MARVLAGRNERNRAGPARPAAQLPPLGIHYPSKPPADQGTHPSRDREGCRARQNAFEPPCLRHA